jgi:2-keto-4-pentenoate hydratase/2-oxohepta-3-ene-1,7-dioic acid hydratase in catechol pathway
MKLATFEANGKERIGIVSGDGLIEIPGGMIPLIADWDKRKDELTKIAREAKPQFRIADVHLLAPVPNPQKILAIGLNYADHVEESGQPMPERQIWFSKLPNAVNGPFDPIEIPAASSAVDYEAELVFIVGKRCRNLSREQAHTAIFGFCAGNDVSVRDWQFHTSQWILGKSFDTHAPFGPYIVTADEVGDPHTLGISCFVNGEKRQDSNTKNLVFGVYDQVALLSQAMTLMPGDVIFTGTPGGVGLASRPPNFLKAGDIVRVEIERVGAIEAKMAPQPG